MGPMPIFKKLLPMMMFLALCSCLSRREQPAPNAVLAEVNGTAIKEDALRSRLNMEQFQGDEGQTTKDPLAKLDVKKNTLNRIVQNKAIVDWGQKQGITLTDKELAQGLAKLKKGYTEREFELMLEEKNSTYSSWSEMAREDLMVQKMMNVSLYSKIKVTPAEVALGYRNNKDQFTVDEQVHVRQITTDTPEKAAALYQRIKNGENFAKVALMHSLSPDRTNGGDLGYFSKGTYPKEFDDACFSLKPGEISPVIKSPYGYHIFKILDKKPKGLLPIETVLPRIESELLQKKLAESFKPWLDDILAQSTIRIDEVNKKALENMR